MNNHCKPWKLRWEETRMKPLRDCALNRENCFFTAVAFSANSKRQGRAAEALMSKHQCQREQTKIVDNPRDSTTVRFYDVVLEVARWTTPHGTRVICVNECFHFKRWLGPGWFIYIYIFISRCRRCTWCSTQRCFPQVLDRWGGRFILVFKVKCSRVL